ncbi:hypothetical protein CASFOL_030176 [Castilleja foliolosa]|uniref:Uncharacterized protein n=1 Tax=Castilleja foliolosa TaxID=1961234 RepID=A0ABD3CD40_9LAMI
MAIIITSGAALTALFIFLLHLGGGGNAQGDPKFEDSDYVELALNLEYLETEFFLFGALGYGLDRVNRSLTKGGPQSHGGQKANLSLLTNAIIT